MKIFKQASTKAKAKDFELMLNKRIKFFERFRNDYQQPQNFFYSINFNLINF